MKTLLLTNEQHALLLAIFESGAMGSDQMQDAVGEAAAKILGHGEDSSDEQIEAEIDLFNSLNDALFGG